MSDVDKQIREQIEGFVNDLSALVRQAALEAVAAALGGEGGSATAGLARGARTSSLPRPSARRGKGAKRTAEELEGTRQSVLDYVRKNPGQGVEQIAKSLNVPSRDLVLPIRKLVADGQLGTKGQKRATKYFVGGSGGGAGAGGGKRRGRRSKK